MQAAIRAASPGFDTASAGGEARYAAVRADLNGDGRDEVLTYLMGPYFCGTGGCTLLVFDQGMDGYSLLADMATTRPPVIVAPSAEGYADVWTMQSGGGAPAEYVQHVFTDGRYVEQAHVPADEVPAGATVLSENTDFAEGRLLEPRG
ncbi:hypothetical protein JDV09_20480 [Mycobacterium sp. Y57]|uniref:hypothetical protein n=1 Tax=Mycolicibacterium xanthum TaxID=2796469 RepID=UPI001C866747|nr:hypothetical protein [Mycolicibacterium xanthum]MBX7434457.1 hypothetical protein [Mycolicibacterium xanthum]